MLASVVFLSNPNVLSVRSIAPCALPHLPLVFCGVVGIVIVAGCSSRPSALLPPKVNANSAASAAVEQFDRNGDGQLAKDEWTASPELAAVAEKYDTNKDGILTSAEIAAGIGAWQNSGMGMRSVPFSVRLNGQALSGAQVRLVPAAFLGGNVKEAIGETSQGGAGQMDLRPEDKPSNAPKMALMQPGLYRVEITHPTAKIPAKYNTATTLGIEITSSNPDPKGVVWSLDTK